MDQEYKNKRFKEFVKDKLKEIKSDCKKLKLDHKKLMRESNNMIKVNLR